MTGTILFTTTLFILLAFLWIFNIYNWSRTKNNLQSLEEDLDETYTETDKEKKRKLRLRKLSRIFFIS